MIKNFFSARLLVAALCVFAGLSIRATTVAHWTNMPEGSKNYGCTIGNYGEGSGATLNKDGSVRLTKQAGGNPNTGIEITMPESFAGNNLSILVKYSDLDRPGANLAYLEIQTDENKKVLAAGNSSSTIYVSTFEGDAGSTHSQGVNDNTSLNAPTEGWMYVSLDRSRNFRFGFISLDGTHTAVHERQVAEGYANGFKKILVGGSTAGIGKYHRIGARIKEIAILQDVAFEDLSPSEMLSGELLTKISDINSLSKDFPSIGFENDATIRIDKALECVALNITTENALTFVRSEDISDDIVADIMKKLQINGKGYSFISKFQDTIKFEDDVVALEETNVAEVIVCEGYTDKLYGVKGGTLVKEGEGTLSSVLVDNATIDIDDGKLIFDEGNGTLAITNATFVLSSSAELNNHGWISAGGTLTFKSDANVTVFSNTARNTDYANTSVFTTNSHPDIEKDGTGRIELRIGADNTSRNINKVTVSDGTLAFGGSAAKVISEVEGTGTLEQAGGGVMTISKVSSETTSLKVSAGALNNECATDNGSLTLAGLEIAAGAIYTMPSINHLNIAKSFYLEGDAHKRWYVTLENGALIATDPYNPMVLNELEFKGNIKLGSKQTVGSVLAKTIKPANLDSIVAKSEDEDLNAFNFALDYAIDSIVVKMQNQEKMMVEAVPDIGLVGAQYRVYVPVPEGYENDPGSIWVTVSNGGPTEDAAQVIKKDENDRWYALIEHSANGLAAGNGQKIDIAVGYRDGANIVKVDSYSDVLVNVRPDAVNNGWINETAHERWSTGEWDSEGEYVVISNGYVQVASDNSISFSPSNVPEEPEAESKIHFSVVFGEGMKLDIINALVDEDQFAGVGLIKEGETYQYCVIDPSIVDGDKYVNAKVAKQSVARIDPKAEHLVEITINHAGNFISYSVDGATLTDTDGKAIFHLPAKTKIAKIDFLGNGAVKNMSAEEYSTKLAAYDGVEYDTIEKAIIAAKGDSTITVTPLWDALWTPSSELRDKAIKFEGDYKVIPVVNDSDLAANDMVLDYDEATKIYKVISKFLTVSIPDPEENDGFGVFLESITTNSMHLVWTYDYKSATPSFAKATVVYGDDVTINFSNTLDNGANGALLVAREGAEDGEGKTIEAGKQVKSVTFHQVRYNTEVKSKHIPVLGGENYDSTARAKVKALYDYGIAAPKAMVADINIIDFTAASDGVTFNIAALDGVSDMDKIAAVSNLVWFSTDLKNWELVADDGIKINEDGSITVKQVGSTGFYKVLIQ